MKKAIISIVVVFAVLFCLVSVVLPRHKANLYSLMYPQNVTYEKGESGKKIALKKDDFFAFGSMYGEPIVWRVLEDGENLLVWSQYLICFKAFDESSSDWAKSDLKAWLNSTDGFLTSENFSAAEKELIFERKNGEKMFLLSKSQLQKMPEKNRAKSPTFSAIEHDGSNKLFIRRNCWYWTSSPISTNSSSVTAVKQTGEFYKTLSSDSLTGVCPAFYLNGSEVYSCGGDGSKEKPFLIQAEVEENES